MQHLLKFAQDPLALMILSVILAAEYKPIKRKFKRLFSKRKREKSAAKRKRATLDKGKWLSL